MKSTAPKISMRGGGANDSTNTATTAAGLAVLAVVAHGRGAGGQLAQGVAGDDPVEVGVAERPDGLRPAGPAACRPRPGRR